MQLTKTVTPWGSLGYITYKRTYARRLVDDNPNDTEEFEDSVERVIEATDSQLNCGFDLDQKARVRHLLLSLKMSVAGRFWWQLGTKTVDRLGLFSLQNCAFIVVNSPITPFTWTFDALMLGSGVGYNIQREFVYEIPKPYSVEIIRKDTSDADFIVPDSREGWTELLRRLLEAHFVTKKGFSYSTICIRGKGSLIKGFGGTASGPEELCWGMGEINRIINERAGKKLRPIDCLDMMNILGAIVVAGNVRRSAQIAIGDCDDIQYLRAKRWDLGNIPNWRAMSNNSVVCNDIALLPEEFWEGYKGNGEPYGLINLKLSQSCGRLGETQYPDPLVLGYNPCAEQSLADGETCCLAELFLPNITSYAELLECITYTYRINKHSLALKCHQEKTAEIVAKHMRMGIGVTGVAQASNEQLSWLSAAYKWLRVFDEEYSKEHGFPASIKLTTVKPSGTLSLLPGVPPGAHPGYALYMIRRIRIAAGSTLLDLCRSHGYHVEPQRNFDGTDDRSTFVVEFPCAYAEGTKLAKDCTAIDQLETVKWLQTNWSDNAVSCTIYYKKEELDTIKTWLNQKFNSCVKSCSFLLHSEHGFHQAPFEEISKEQYEELVAKVKPIIGIKGLGLSDIDLAECESGACPIR